MRAQAQTITIDDERGDGTRSKKTGKKKRKEEEGRMKEECRRRK